MMSIQNNYSIYGLLDRITGAQQVIQTDHNAIHEGFAYSVDTVNAALADNNYLSIAIKTGSKEYVHLKKYIPWINGDYGVATLIEGCTISGGNIASRNRNRAAIRPVVSEIKTGVTITGGTTIETQILSGGGGLLPISSGAISSLDVEWVLKLNTQYAIKLLNSTGGAAESCLWAFFYEEERGN
jgi:hypothetical protein